MIHDKKWFLPGLLLAGILILQSCSYTAIPRSVPMVREMDGLSFKGISVLVTNAETDAAEQSIPTETKRSSAFKANKRAWSQKLVESLAGELARRGADIRVSAPIVLSVALPKIVFTESRELVELRARAAVTLSGWTKEFEGTAKKKTSGVYSVSEEMDRLAGQALSDIITQIISDAELSAQLRAPLTKTGPER